MKADILRGNFLNFFKSKGHRVVESDSLVPRDDPTVLFTPAGMNQFKKEFLGLVSDFRSAATSQRCLRTDDLEKVGKTRGHHTFFEMLGNFSFGDYSKAEAIAWAWEFLTVELKIPCEKLWVSVYKDDDEAYGIWSEKIKVPAGKIVRLGDKENFWPSEAKAKGPNGPCGPCSEIFFDQGEAVGCGPNCNPGCKCDKGRFLEVWNLVFTQFNRKEGGVLEPLPQKNIDTGMGLERLAAVMQGVPNNFETDLFQPLIEEIKGHSDASVDKANTPSLYAVADHIRAIVFAIYDGVLPSNEERGYVIRKLIRISIIHLRCLGITKPFLNKLVPILTNIMQAPYPELISRREDIAQIILKEEENYINLLETSDPLMEQHLRSIVDAYKKNPEQQKVAMSVQLASKAFFLYDTLGIPADVPVKWAGKQGVRPDTEVYDKEFNEKLAEQKKRSRQSSTLKGDVFDIKELHLDIKESRFLGYTDSESESVILKIIKAGAEVDSISTGDEAQIILDKTPFYAESGGQVGDSGELIHGSDVFEVADTKRTDKVSVHIGRVKNGNFKKSSAVQAKVDLERRAAIARNHTATHLLQTALRKVLGEHVQQQGSLVAADRLRFDFTHFKDITAEQLDRVEEIVNAEVITNHKLSVKEMPLSEAKKTGALAFFGEKYSESVRVVSISEISKELCGGTHLESTGEIGLFKIIHEGSVASGVRRIEAITGKVAYKAAKEQEKVLTDISSSLGVPLEKAGQELAKRLARIKDLEKQLNSARIEALKSSISETIGKAEVINGVKLIIQDYPNADMDFLRKAVDLIKEQVGPIDTVVAAMTTSAVSIYLAIGVTGQKLDAGKLIKEIAPELGGSGGGRKDFAQAGGNKPQNFPAVIQKLKDIIRLSKT